MQVDSTAWSGEGTFTQLVLDKLRRMEDVAAIRIEDAPSTRSEADYNFVSNEIFVRFEMRSRKEPGRRFGFLPATRVVTEKVLSLVDLAGRLASDEDVGPADYSDEGMVQYLRTERIVPPYQTRGYKLVELLRIYESGSIGPDQQE
ncbi:MAG TPA: hypothetical protein VH701_18620 [Vicinamibacterales bacterium]|jgi:hypothetical protein